MFLISKHSNVTLSVHYPNEGGTWMYESQSVAGHKIYWCICVVGNERKHVSHTKLYLIVTTDPWAVE